MPYQLSESLNPVFQTSNGFWFGYYNYDTLNHDQTKMLCARTLHDAELIKKGYYVEIGYFDILSGEWHKVGMSDSYNWPQGCMAQWLPGKGNEDKIIYNTSDGVKNIAVIVDVITLEEKIIDWSIYGLTPDGKKSIALVMERSHWCRAYHYESIADNSYDGQVYEDDGIFEIDLENNKRRKLISIQKIISVDKEDYFDFAKHWLEHIMISPNGKRFCFLHRFSIGNVNNYETRLFIADINGENLQCVEGWRKFYWSHFGWNGNDAFAIYSYETNKHTRVLHMYEKEHLDFKDFKTNVNYVLKSINLYANIFWKKIVRLSMKKTSSYYQYYKFQRGKFVLDQHFNNRMFKIDGHPSFTNDGKYMITDTYPNSNKYQDLLIYNLETKKVLRIGSFFAKLHRAPGSCDLHPKLCKNNKYLVIDSAYDGKHHAILCELKWENIKRNLL